MDASKAFVEMDFQFFYFEHIRWLKGQNLKKKLRWVLWAVTDEQNTNFYFAILITYTRLLRLCDTYYLQNKKKKYLFEI